MTGAALDPKFTWALSNLMVRMGLSVHAALPQLGLSRRDVFHERPCHMGSTVSILPEATDTKVRATVGDFVNGIRWGVKRAACRNDHRW